MPISNDRSGRPCTRNRSLFRAVLRHGRAQITEQDRRERREGELRRQNEATTPAENPKGTLGCNAQGHDILPLALEGWARTRRVQLSFDELILSDSLDCVVMAGAAELTKQMRSNFVAQHKAQFQIPSSIYRDRFGVDTIAEAEYVQAMQSWLFETNGTIQDCPAYRWDDPIEVPALDFRSSALGTEGDGLLRTSFENAALAIARHVISWDDFQLYHKSRSHTTLPDPLEIRLMNHMRHKEWQQVHPAVCDFLLHIPPVFLFHFPRVCVILLALLRSGSRISTTHCAKRRLDGERA